ncbi:MAG: 4-hydroxythreonine-4-phosphate dehydrogenase PdxA [Proteobacteria bacterium]|nr:4-hydroxythreonine-4-phosphate dehydrogenase PdxA [Pseudomonadota bacterium]
MGEIFSPILGVSLGDPAGVGPEVVVKALAEPEVHQYCRPVIIGDLNAVTRAIKRAGLDLGVRLLSSGEEPEAGPGFVQIMPVSDLGPDDIRPGRPTPAGGKAAARYIETGARMALAGRIHGLVTAPISKEALNRAGYAFPGHTEMLAHLAKGAEVVMMLAGERLRVVLVTIHEPLRAVPDILTPDRIVTTARITHQAFQKYFGLPEPRLAAAALNPHAGEKGLFGREEAEVIGPAVAEAQRRGIRLSGPFPADTLFYRAMQGEFDGVVAMYHDQGLIPFKLLHFKDGVNVTLGLPFIRTSVDHGTAYDLAGCNVADHSSLKAAIKMAADMAIRSGVSP